jgi:hypothetical protein
MARAKVYIETSIPSFFFETRSEPEMVARRDWTRQWWREAAPRYTLMTSVAVIEELDRGDFSPKQACLRLIDPLPLLPIEPPVSEIVEAYIRHHVMPSDPLGDALHLALASYHKSDFLLTWNCRHLANANKFGHIRRVNTLLGLFVPALVTPLELLGADDEED